MRFFILSRIIICILLFCLMKVDAQVSFDSELKSKDPISRNLPVSERVKIYADSLEVALEHNDSLGVIYNYLYLIDDLTTLNDYTEAMKVIILAENFVSNSLNSVWKGQVSHRKGTLYAFLGNYKDATEQFEISLEQSTEGRDHHNMAINLEQLGAMHGYQEHYDISDEYYTLAFAAIEKYCSKKTLAIALANYGNVKSHSGDDENAEVAYLKAIDINREIGNLRNESICKNNLASIYYDSNKDRKALESILECIEINETNNWNYLLIDNYSIAAKIYKRKNKWDEAYTYIERHYTLSDSLLGSEIQNNIAHLETENKILNKNLEISNAENALYKAERKYKNSLIIGGLVLLVMIMVFMYFLIRRKINNFLLKESRFNVRELTKTLAAKNNRIHELESKSQREKEDSSHLLPENIINPYSDTILTNEDWQSFKGAFENVYPKTIQGLRIQYPTITEAEERLFLLLKLELTSLEISHILGVLPNTVKKTRLRLRKRLNLKRELPLEELIRSF